MPVVISAVLFCSRSTLLFTYNVAPHVFTAQQLRALPAVAAVIVWADSLRMVGHVGVHEDDVRPRYHPQPVHVGRPEAHLTRARENPYNFFPV